MNFGGVTVPVNHTCVVENFWSRAGDPVAGDSILRRGLKVTGDDVCDSVVGEPGAEMHELIVESADVVVGSDFDFLLRDDVAGVDFVLEEKGGDARNSVAVDDGPVDGSRSAIFG